MTAHPPVNKFGLWNLGFRPFYLLASIFSALSVLLWAAQFSAYLPAAYLQGPVWHGHEMLFGYTVAVIAGFLLTAVRAWTNQPTASGGALMALAALWVAGRVLVLTPYAMPAAVINAAFPVALAVAKAVERIPEAGALPGGCLFEPKWDGFIHCNSVNQWPSALLPTH